MTGVGHLVAGAGNDLPCDGYCDEQGGPVEDCSRHGRRPADLWAIIKGLRADRDRLLELAMDNAYRHGQSIDAEHGCCHTAQEIRQGYRDFEPWGHMDREPLPISCPGRKAAAEHLQALSLITGSNNGLAVSEVEGF